MRCLVTKATNLEFRHLPKPDGNRDSDKGNTVTISTEKRLQITYSYYILLKF